MKDKDELKSMVSHAIYERTENEEIAKEFDVYSLGTEYVGDVIGIEIERIQHEKEKYNGIVKYNGTKIVLYEKYQNGVKHGFCQEHEVEKKITKSLNFKNKQYGQELVYNDKR